MIKKFARELRKIAEDEFFKMHIKKDEVVGEEKNAVFVLPYLFHKNNILFTKRKNP